jgi:hypothetical protein
LHLLRNTIVKAVIRVGAGSFDHDSRFFLVGAGSEGKAVRRLISLNSSYPPPHCAAP